jgi:hypothetical protein
VCAFGTARGWLPVFEPDVLRVSKGFTALKIKIAKRFVCRKGSFFKFGIC